MFQQRLAQFDFGETLRTIYDKIYGTNSGRNGGGAKDFLLIINNEEIFGDYSEELQLVNIFVFATI